MFSTVPSKGEWGRGAVAGAGGVEVRGKAPREGCVTVEDDCMRRWEYGRVSAIQETPEGAVPPKVHVAREGSTLVPRPRFDVHVAAVGEAVTHGDKEVVTATVGVQRAFVTDAPSFRVRVVPIVFSKFVHDAYKLKDAGGCRRWWPMG